MATYRCPHCSALMRHKPELAGDRVVCSKCGGHYFEPTDPLPGIKPEIAPPIETGALDDPAYSTPASSSSLNLAAELSSSKSAGPALGQIDPQALVDELERRGMHALAIAWPASQPEKAGLVYSKGTGREGADKMILEAAFRLIAARWPELSQLLSNYERQM